MTIERIGGRHHNIESTQTSSRIDHQFYVDYLQSMLKTQCIEPFFTTQSHVFSAPSEHSLSRALNTDAMPCTETTSITPRIKHTTPSQTTSSESLDSFITLIWPYAKEASQRIGLDPKLLMAQVALETGWGTFIAKDKDGSSSYNLFNIKANHTDPSVNIKTTEYLNNIPIKMVASFKKYPSIQESFKDYMSLMNAARYQDARANVHDPQHYLHSLHQAGFATDPEYAQKILSIYHGDKLQGVLERNDCV